MAQERQVDLVEISPNANPPVAKLLDFDKYRYQQEKLAQQSKRKVKKVSVKGIRLTVRIGTHDLEFKAKQTNEFLAEGHKCKVDVFMRGREQAHADLAFELIKKFLTMLTTPFVTETGPSRMGHTVSVTIGPNTKNN